MVAISTPPPNFDHNPAVIKTLPSVPQDYSQAGVIQVKPLAAAAAPGGVMPNTFDLTSRNHLDTGKTLAEQGFRPVAGTQNLFERVIDGKVVLKANSTQKLLFVFFPSSQAARDAGSNMLAISTYLKAQSPTQKAAIEANGVSYSAANEIPKKIFDVTFFDAHGDLYHIQKITEGDTLPKLPGPDLAGYTFVGWVDSTGALFDFSTPVTGNVTLLPKFEKAEQFGQNFTLYSLTKGTHDRNGVMSGNYVGPKTGTFATDAEFLANARTSSGVMGSMGNRIDGSPQYSWEIQLKDASGTVIRTLYVN